jgi:predicted  nucleic acid-binding Zn-ribbon protein
MPYSVQDQITELSKKLALHEGDLKAYDEASKQEIQQNFEKITELRASNKTLHKKLADSVNGDCKVIENALGDRKVEKQALRSKPGREAVEIIDQKVCDYIKKLNAMKAETERKRKKCEEAKIRKEMVSKDLNDQMANSKGESEQAKYLRSIENRLDKAILKQQEAEHVKALYEKMRDQLQSKALTFHNTLEAREMEIEEANRELKRVKEMLVDAQVGFHFIVALV